MKFIKANGLIHENNVIYKTSYRENTTCTRDKHTHCYAQNTITFSCERRSLFNIDIACLRYINKKKERIRFIKIKCFSKNSKEE